MDQNKFINMEGLEILTELAFLSLNSNRINKLDMDQLKAIRHIEAANNSITTISGTAGLRNLRWLDLSNNPIRSLDFLKDSDVLCVLLIRAIRVCFLISNTSPVANFQCSEFSKNSYGS
jgi:Leucine-rich repeat (LRR) protein